MTADLRQIVDDIATRAEDLLPEPRDRKLARAGIEEEITMDYPTLSPTDHAAVVAGVMGMLNDEDFFGIEFVGNPFSDVDDTDED